MGDCRKERIRGGVLCKSAAPWQSDDGDEEEGEEEEDDGAMWVVVASF